MSIKCKKIGHWLVLLLILQIPACKTNKKVQTKWEPRPAQPIVQILPPQGHYEPRVAEIPTNQVPIYRNPIIEEVEMAPYVNEDGNLVFPGKILVIREPGRWNLDAARRNQRYYIPPENLPPQMALPSHSYYNYIQTKRNDQLQLHQMDLSKVRVTGMMRREDEALASQMVMPGETLVFDNRLGWLILPNSYLDTPTADPLATPQPAMPPINSTPNKNALVAPMHPANPPQTTRDASNNQGNSPATENPNKELPPPQPVGERTNVPALFRDLFKDK